MLRALRTIFTPRRRDDVGARFERSIGPHLDAAYNLARYLTRNDQDAEDVVQEAMVRAFTFFAGFQGGDCRAWLLTIVRNTGYTLLRRRKSEHTTPFDEDLHDTGDPAESPETSLLESYSRETLRSALQALPVEFREALILREMEGMSYREIADITGAPMGTVMSRLARARQRLQVLLTDQNRKECSNEL